MDRREGPWTPEEDKMMQNLAAVFGMDWSLISKSIPGRTVKSCWSRWISLCWTFTPEEEEMLENLVHKHGLNWSLISKSIPGKSAMSCKTRWSLLTPKGISLSLKRKSGSMTDEDKTIVWTMKLTIPPHFLRQTPEL
ncbi:transcription factor MYB44-like protein [Tanacetum coccineum]